MKNINKILSICLVASTLVWQTSCTKKEKTTASTSTEAFSTMEIPPLYERRGELAKAEEWARTKIKVDELTKKITKDPKDVKARLQVAMIYLSEARITGEHPYYYPIILKILDGVLNIDPKNFDAITFKSSVKMSQHQFAEAKVLAEKARDINPANAYVYGVLVDANVELGNYEEAVVMSDKMQGLKPSLESYTRASYLREIYGQYKGSIEAMQMAAQAGVVGSEPYCWSKNTLGHLYETTGKVTEAKREYDEILAIRPSYAFAMKGLANIHKSKKEYPQALDLLEKAVQIIPEFSFHEQIAEIYALQGETEKAKNKYAEVVKMLDEDAKSGHTVDLELCKLYTKTNTLDSALVYGLKEFAKRPKNIDVNNALAWVYYNQKNLPKAQEHIAIALRMGTQDPELLQRASVIAQAGGDVPQKTKLLAAAKKVNPNFVL